MTAEEARDALATDPRLGALAEAGRPAFAVDREGRLVWANPVAAPLLGAIGLDGPTTRTLARMASSGAGGLVRIRLGALGRLAPVAMQARPAGDFLALEGLEAVGPAVSPAPEAPSRDVATEEGAETADAPPDPRHISASSDVANGGATPTQDVSSTKEAAPAIAPDEPFRFTFELDRELRLTVLSPEFERAVGPSAAGALGRPWGELAAELALDPDGAVAEALAGRRGWGELAVRWPVADGRRLPIALSALPMFDRGREFAGFRGLGRSAGEPELAEPSPPEPAAGVTQMSEPEPDAAQALDSPVAAATDSLRSAETAEIPSASGDVPDRPVPALTFVEAETPPALPHNVVALHDAAQRGSVLSAGEESAFDEIARRLRSLEGGRAVAPQTPAAERPEADWALEGLEGHTPLASPAEDIMRVLDRLPVGALLLQDGAVEHANRTALDMLGHRDLASLKARSANSLFAEAPPRDDAAPATLRLIADDGVEVEVEARLSRVPWGGAPATLVSLKRAEGAIAAVQSALDREKELAATLDAAVDGVMTLDGAGRILAVNRGAETLFGFEGRDVVGSLFTLSLAPESRRAAFDCLDQVKAGASGPEAREVLGLARQGGAIPLHLTIGRIGGAETSRFCAVLQDVTRWRRAEEELRVAKRQAERANAQKSDFLAKVSHEIRTPLNAIIGFAEVMMEERFGPVGSPRYKDYLKDIHTSGAHLIGLVDDLLELTRIETGKMKFDFTPVDLNEIVQQAATLLQPQATRGRVIIRTSLARSLPPVLADRRSVRQIMTNLASNAVRFSRPGGQVIVATALTETGQAVIRVRDAGLGMTRQELERAMEPFRPLAIADNDTGAGLGLPLTKALAEANEAALQLQSEVGRGTLAEVTFPASRVLAS